MENELGRIFMSGYRTRQDKDGRGEGERGLGMANTKVCQRSAKVFEIGKLLLLIH